MPILNYTTQVDFTKSALEIQMKLAYAGAMQVMVDYDKDRRPTAISFRINTPHGLLSFYLNPNVQGVFDAMKRNPKIPHRYKTMEQAKRVAWRIEKDSVEVMLAKVEAGSAKLAQMFMYCVQDAQGRTFYQIFEAGGIRQLTEGPKDELERRTIEEKYGV
jgi:hypothetical protein